MSDGWSLNVASGDDLATQQLTKSITLARNLGMGLMILAAALLGVVALVKDLSMLWGGVVCLLHVGAHALICEGLRRYVLRIATKRQVTVEINAAPRAHVRRGWLRRAGHQGGVALWTFIATVILLLWDAYLLVTLGMGAFALREGDSLLGLIFIAVVWGAMLIPTVMLMGAALDRAHARIALVEQDALVSEHLATALEQQGGELSVAAEAFGGELSIAQARQGGELGVYEAEDVASEASAVEVSAVSEVSR